MAHSIVRMYITRAFWICASVVLVLSLLPPFEMPSTGWDKSNHLLAFSALAVLGIRAYPAFIVPVILGLLVYGGLIEVLQALTPYRYAEWFDVLANAAGLLIGWTVERLLRWYGR
jgi:VanZ family protein